jgi:hypothetical protein
VGSVTVISVANYWKRKLLPRLYENECHPQV